MARKPSMTAPERREAARMYASGLSLDEVAVELGRGRRTIRSAVEENGGSLRPRVKYDEAWICDLYASGLSIYQIQKRHGIPAASARHALVRAGVALRAREFYRGEWSQTWKGGRRFQGRYVDVKCPGHPKAVDGYVREHVLVMEQMLGGPIPEGHHVHHRNGIKSDNRPENLELLTAAEHTRHHLPDMIRRRWPEGAVAAGGR